MTLDALDLDVAASRLVCEIEAQTKRSLAAHRQARRRRARASAWRVLGIWGVALLGAGLTWLARRRGR